MALAVVAIGLADCNHVLVVILYIVGYGLSGISGSGVGVITLDMAPQYAGRQHVYAVSLDSSYACLHVWMCMCV